MKVDSSFYGLLRVLVLVLVFVGIGQAATNKASHRPRIYADASLIDGLIAAPVPNYPVEALKEGWSGFGVFELQFRPDGTVKNVVTVLTTEHQLLDDTARASLLQWRCKAGSHGSVRMTMHFSIHRSPVTLKPDSREVMENFPVHPYPTYPIEARRQRWTGVGLFVMRFRPNGEMEKVVALKSTGHTVLDEECVRTFMRWRCRPDLYTTAYVPVNFVLNGYRVR